MACIDFHQTASVGDGSDPLQLIKFWPSCAAGKGVCSGAKTFGSALLHAASAQCLRLSERFFSFHLCLFVCFYQDYRKNYATDYHIIPWKGPRKKLSVFGGGYIR